MQQEVLEVKSINIQIELRRYQFEFFSFNKKKTFYRRFLCSIQFQLYNSVIHPQNKDKKMYWHRNRKTKRSDTHWLCDFPCCKTNFTNETANSIEYKKILSTNSGPYSDFMNI